ncbi:MAG: peptidoglycan-binding protein [Deltaproteobacteria bacterium]|nr:peptidoglycan-binding protein [Deltaproteobacteria bacterium]
MTKEHVVRKGDCISSIADAYGHFWETVWNFGKNSELKNLRVDPNILLPGDVVQVPDKEENQVPGETDTRHKFRKKGVPAKIRLKVMREPPAEDSNGESGDVISSSRQEPDEVCENLPYILEIDGAVTNGNTDSEGIIEISIPPGAKKGKLIIEPNTPLAREIPLELGNLDPISEVRGVKQRLANLGFDCGNTNNDKLNEDIERALRAFQSAHGLEVTGEIDQATRDELKDAHGS